MDEMQGKELVESDDTISQDTACWTQDTPQDDDVYEELCELHPKFCLRGITADDNRGIRAKRQAPAKRTSLHPAVELAQSNCNELCVNDLLVTNWCQGAKSMLPFKNDMHQVTVKIKVRK